MSQTPTRKFKNAIVRCRSKYHLFRQLASRTRNALYVALGEGYDLFLEMPGNDALRAEFDQALSSQNMRRSDRESLLLIEYAYFPHVLLPGIGHKPDIDKASSYANVFDKAAAANITSAEFVPWVREKGGIQKIAHGETAGTSRRAQRTPLGKSARVKSHRISGPAVTAEPSESRLPVLPEIFLCSPGVLQQVAQTVQAAHTEQQIVTFTGFMNGKCTVVTAIEAEPWHGPFPWAGYPINGSSIPKARQSPAGGKVVPKTARRPTPMKRPVPPSRSAPSRPEPKQPARPGKAPWHL